ncbi:nicotinamide mononucleotide transporter [Limosilactobacillus reuteri]|uniref:Nicotinamide mononucleotide transporter n=1 Tax=Limosilactobacillus reuteri TaxID=1598 RepID=A0A073JQH8_LIMRT|nr:nicotinamide riboside transporter PnuC [Limosilactobacillus reuteri]KEK16118.1 nicotinamide mononucleotide transporter [Limosilactobacillus reuteri]OYS80592.1 nicotinamide mononucleotide transporter [Limosilactobacillus reuteri]OYS81423.1 nicotinamide mononucleotide transporter [Limosilactobacillus reuteri]OYS83742.1 nicotinamide mononucleotide transporter [Limosilactobacillus reuteri]
MDNSIEKIAWYNVVKPSWYVEQMKGWTTRSYGLLLTGIGLIVGMTIGGGVFNSVTMATMFAGVLGFTCTLSITNTKPLNGVLGLVSALIYIVVAVQAKNYNDVLLQAIYILLLDLPVLLMPSWAKDVDKKVRFLHERGRGLTNWVLVIVFFVVLTGILYYSDTHIFISPRPWIDSIAASIGITGAVLTTLRFSESYYCWTIQGLMSVILWGVTAAQGDANFVLFVTYILYLTNDMLAFFDKNVSWFHHKTAK